MSLIDKVEKLTEKMEKLTIKIRKLGDQIREDALIEDDHEYLLRGFERIEENRKSSVIYAYKMLYEFNRDIHAYTKDNLYDLIDCLFCRYIDIFNPFYGYEMYFDTLDDRANNLFFEKTILLNLKEELKRIKKDKSYKDLRLVYEILEEINLMNDNRVKKYNHELYHFDLSLRRIHLHNDREQPFSNAEMEDRVLKKVKLLEEKRK